MYLTVLWSEYQDQRETGKFDIKEHDSLKEAALYLVKNGAKYENQEIVQKINWLPGEGNNPQQPTVSAQNEPTRVPQGGEEVGPPPGVVSGPVDQPQVMDFSRPGSNTQTGKKKSIFDGIVPAHLMPMVQGD